MISPAKKFPNGVMTLPLGPELIKALCRELNDRYVGKKIRKADAANLSLLVAFDYADDLLFSCDPVYYGCCSIGSEEKKEFLDAAHRIPPFSLAARSHLVGCEMIGASQIQCDRVLELSFMKRIGAGFSQIRKLVFEAAGRYSNLILTDEEGVIIESLKQIYPETNRYRSTYPGIPYTPPPAFEGQTLEKAIETGPVDFMKLSGFGRPLLEAAARRAAAIGTRGVLDELGKIYDSACSEDTRFYMTGKYLTLYPARLDSAAEIDERSALRASRRIVITPVVEDNLSKRRGALLKILTKKIKDTRLKIDEARRTLADEELPQRLMDTGKLILANTWQIERGAASATLTEWTENGERTRTVTLDPLLDSTKNAEKFFTKYRKAKAAQTRAKTILPKLEEELETLLCQETFLMCADDISRIAALEEEVCGNAPGAGAEKAKKGKKTKNPTAPPHKRFDVGDDAVIFVGLSAKGNHYVTFRLATPNDIWFHAKDIPGAHVILRATGSTKENIDDLYRTCASLAAYFSKGRDSGKVSVDYTERRYVSAISGALAHVTYREFKTILAETDAWRELLNEKSGD